MKPKSVEDFDQFHSKCGDAKIEDENAVSVPLLSCTKDSNNLLTPIALVPW